MLLALSLALNMGIQEMRSDTQDFALQSPHPDAGLFLGSGMSGVVITLNPGQPGSDLRNYISHLDGGQGSVEALVSTFGSGPFNGLLDVVGRENPIDHRDAGIKAN